MLFAQGSAMNLTVDNCTKTEVNVDIENATIDRDENLAKIEIATLAIIFLVTVLGNGTVLLALWTRRRYAGRKKLSRMYFFILHLSIADLITAFLSVLPQLGWEVTYRFNGGFILCKVVKYGQTLGPYLSSYVLMATAIDRHQAICYPLTYCSWTSRRSKVMVWIAWAASLVFCIPQVHYYDPSDGTANKGHLYERKLASLLALRLYNSKKKFNLLINAKNFDKWDDVVIIIHENDVKHLYCFQLKHVTGASNAVIRPDMFEQFPKKTKSVCELKKLFAGYQKIKTHLLTTDPAKNELFENIDMKNVKLVLFTNMKGKLFIREDEIVRCGELFETVHGDNEDNTIIELTQFKKKAGTAEEWDEFFQHFCYVGNQVGEIELNLLIREEIEKLLNLKEDVILTKIFKHYLEYIELWTDGKLGGFYALTQKHVRISLMGILMSILEIIVPSGDAFEDNEGIAHTEWTAVISEKCLVVLQHVDDNILSFLYAAIAKSQDKFEIAVMKKILKDEVVNVKQVLETLQLYNFNLPYYLSKDTESSLYSPKNTKLLLWKLGLIPLAVKVRNVDDTNIVRTILDIVKEEKITIIVVMETEMEGLSDSSIKQSVRYLQDVEDRYMDIIYKKYIKIHNNTVTLRELLKTCASLKSKLTTENIIQILTNNCAVGNTFEYKSFHISRQIPAIGLNTEVLQIRTDILVIFGNKATMRSLEFIPDVDVSGCVEHKVGNKITEKTLLKRRILLIASTDEESCYDIYRDVCKFTNKNVHFIKLHLFGHTVLLQWLRTSTTIEIIRKYRISSEKLEKQDITLINGTVNVLSADPGYGKTTMMLQLAQQQKEHLIIFITLADQAEYFLRTETVDNLEHLRYFFNCKCAKSELQLNIFNAFLDEGKILVIFDGIDEISTEHKDRILSFIQKIALLNIKIWITCRICVQEEIENTVGTLAFKLNTFNENEQNEFLKKYSFSDNKKRDILNDKRELFEIPLYLYMLCESLSGSSSILNLCDDFIQTEIRKCSEKNALTSSTQKYLSSKLNKFIGKYALHNTFPKELIKNVVDGESLEEEIQYFVKSGYTSFGLIRKLQTNSQDQYVFIHKAIGDYIAAKALTETEHMKNHSAIMEYLFGEKLTQLRYLFYKLLTEKQSKDVLKHAVLDKNFREVQKYLEKTSPVSIEEDFTTPLHLAAQWGKRHYYSADLRLGFNERYSYRDSEIGTEDIVALLLKNRDILELLNQKDKLLSWTPIQYADHSGSLGILEEFAKTGTFDVSSSQLLSKMPQSILLYFCIKYHYNHLFNLLYQKQKLDLSLRCPESGNTFLHNASAYGNTDVVEILLDNISIDVLNKQKETPLHVAAYGYENVVSLLIARKAPLEITDKKGYTPLHRAVKRGQLHIVKLLINNGANLKTCTLNGYSLLHAAAYCSNVAILKLLIRGKVEVNHFDNMGNLPLHTAVEWNSIECVKILVDKTSNINIPNKYGQTPFHLAIRNGQLDVVKVLVSNGAKLNEIDFDIEVSPSVAKYLEPLSKNQILKKYTSRSGTNSGRDFIIKMTALISLRCCKSETEEMYITTDSEECGVFGDIILLKKTKIDAAMAYLIQMKHQDNPEAITLKEFKEVDGNYSLNKYKAEIDNLCSTLRNVNEQKSFIINYLNTSTVRLALFTNRGIQNNNYDFLEVVDDKKPFLNIINTSGNTYRIKLQSSPEHTVDLPNNFYLFTQQISGQNIDLLIEKSFAELLDPLKLPAKVLQKYIKEYIIFVGKWQQGKLGGHCLLAKDHIICFLTDLLLHPYIKISEHDKINRKYSIRSSESDIISTNMSLKVVDAKENRRLHLYQEIIHYLETCWNDLPETTSWTEYFSEEAHSEFYKSNQNNKHHLFPSLFRIVGKFGRTTLLDVYKCMWLEKKIPLVLEITSKQDYEDILAIHKLSEGALKIILLNRTNQYFHDVNIEPKLEY